jgi:hypothetical protein
MRRSIVAAALALGLVTPWVAILPLIAQPRPVSLSPIISKGLFRCRRYHCIDQTRAAELAEVLIVEQPKHDAAAVVDRRCHPDLRTFPKIGTESQAN